MHAITRFRSFPYDEQRVASALRAALEQGKSRCVCFVAVDSAGQVAGGLLAVLERHIFTDKLTASVMHYDVLPERRMGGYGVRLMTAFEQWARNRKVAEISFGINSGTGQDSVGRFASRRGSDSRRWVRTSSRAGMRIPAHCIENLEGRRGMNDNRVVDSHGMGVPTLHVPVPPAARAGGWVRSLLALASFPLLSAAAPVWAQARPLDFTPGEKAQFQDATDRFRRVALPEVGLAASAAAWMDSGRIIYSTSELPGVWKAQSGELAKVVVFHVANGAIEQTPYRGSLLCYTPERMIIGAPAAPHAGGFNPGRERLLAGKFGDSLQPATEIAGREVLRYSCELNPIVAAAPANAAVTRVPLLSGHGFLRIPRGHSLARGAEAVPGYDLLDAQGRLVKRLTGAAFPLQWQINYLPWAGAYFADKGALFPSQMFWPDGQSRLIPAPPLLASLGPGVASGQAVPTRAGTLWNFVPWHAFWHMQGLYLQTERGALLRVDDGFIPALPGVNVSADGCAVFYFRRAGNPGNSREPFVPTVMNVCEGGRHE